MKMTDKSIKYEIIEEYRFCPECEEQQLYRGDIYGRSDLFIEFRCSKCGAKRITREYSR